MQSLQQMKEGFQQRFMEAMNQDSPEAVAQGVSETLNDFGQQLQEQILQQHKELEGEKDATVLAQRGIRQLTSAEKKYYQSLGNAMRSSNPRQALENLDVVMPETVIDRIYEDLKSAHPLLDAINFKNTSAMTKFLLSASGGVAGWGELCSSIDDELSAGFHVLDMSLYKLSAYIPVCNAMLDIGPAWLDSYVRQLLSEALAVELEAAIIDGDGVNKPIGMTRTLALGAGGVHAAKTPVAITSLTPEGIAPILASLSVKKIIKDDGTVVKEAPRAVGGLIMVVNPTDYFSKVYPAITPRALDGSFNTNVLPYPMNVIQSVAVPAGKAVIGIASAYFMGLGTGQSKAGVIEYSEHVRFLDDWTVYRAKLYGNGRPTDETAFSYVDISGVTPTPIKVEVVNASDDGGGGA